MVGQGQEIARENSLRPKEILGQDPSRNRKEHMEGRAMKRPKRSGKYLNFNFSLEDIADFICEFTQDGKNPQGRDVVKWFRWFERKCGVRKSYIFGGR